MINTLSEYNKFQKRPAKIKIIGAGNLGCNIVSKLIKMGFTGVKYYAIDSDRISLGKCVSKNKIQIGKREIRGNGTFGDIDLAKRALEEVKSDIMNEIRNTDIAFIVAGLGGGIGTAGLKALAEYAKESGILAVSFAIEPFLFEGDKKQKTTSRYLYDVEKASDTTILIKSDLAISKNETVELNTAFNKVDDILFKVMTILGRSITPNEYKKVTKMGPEDLINLLKNAGPAVVGIGEAEGVDRAENAAFRVLGSELLYAPIDRAKKIVINVEAGNNLTLDEVNKVVEIIKTKLSPAADIMVTGVLNPKLQDKMNVVLTAIDFTAVLHEFTGLFG